VNVTNKLAEISENSKPRKYVAKKQKWDPLSKNQPFSHIRQVPFFFAQVESIFSYILSK